MLLSSSSLNAEVYPSFRSQIISLIAKKTLIKVSTKYGDCADVFFPDLASKLLEHIGINDHVIELADD